MLETHNGDDPLASAMAELVDNFASPSDVEGILETVTARSVELIHEIDFADVLLIDERQHRSMAPTAAFITDLDDAQLRLQEGPCLDAAVEDATVVSTDLTTETRWPRFAAVATEAGVKSMMSL